MLYIVVNRNGNLTESRWHVGKFSPVPSQDAYLVSEVQADGSELDYLTARFPFIKNNRPQEPSGFYNGNWQSVGIVRWFGDDARFIVGNLT